jgi:hypothetical protein
MKRLGRKAKRVLFGSMSFIGLSGLAPSAQADPVVVYSDNFAGSSSSLLNGAAPGSFDNSGGEIGTSTPVWVGLDNNGSSTSTSNIRANGSVVPGGISSFAYLPFTPQIGAVYQYSATLNCTQTGTNNSRWLAMGFTAAATKTRWIDPGGNGSAFLLHRAGGYTSTVFDSAFIGPDNGGAAGSSAATGGQDGGTAANIMLPVAQLTLTPVDVIITLDTTSPDWVVTWQMRNHNNPTDPFTTARGPLQYATIDPTIHDVGLMALNGITAQASTLQLVRLTTTPTWNVDGDGTWTPSDNWQNNVPNAAGAAAVFGPNISAPRTVTLDANQTVGSLVFTSPISYTVASSGGSAINIDDGSLRGGINVAAGSHTISAPLTQSAPIDIAVADGASVTLSGHDTLAITNLNLTGSGKLDLANSSLVFNYTGTTSPLGTLAGSGILGKLKSGFNGGAWNGTGISSSTAAGDINSATALGYAEATDLGMTSFQGQTIANKAVIVKYTYYGDANLDGVVDASDFQRLLDGLVNNSSNWSQGDFTYDGKVDLGNDFDLFLTSYLANGSALGDLAPIILNDADLTSAQKESMLAVVPEPVSLGMVALGACLYGSRRRRR